MSETPLKAVRLHVLRGQGQGPSHTQTFELPPGSAASLLDGLCWLREHVDPTLAFRYACINANACKECMVRVDGETVYACVVRLVPGATLTVEPLPNKTRLRDLVTEIAPSKEQWRPDEAC